MSMNQLHFITVNQHPGRSTTFNSFSGSQVLRLAGVISRYVVLPVTMRKEMGILTKITDDKKQKRQVINDSSTASEAILDK